MKKLIAVAAVAVALTLTGCSAAPAVHQAAKIANTKPAASAEVTPSTTPTAAPATIEPTAPLTAAESRAQSRGFSSQREWLLRSVADVFSGNAPSDDALVGAALLACKQMHAGTKLVDVRVVNGATVTQNNAVARDAAEVYCPEFF